MSCAEWREALKGWLEAGSFAAAGEVPPRLQSHARECAGCAARLAAARMLLGGEGLPAAPPPWLAARVAARVAAQAAGRPAWFWKAPRFFRWAPVPLAAALAAAVTAFLVLTPAGPGRAEPDTVVIRLELEAPQAGDVSVVGDWNGWDPEADRLSDADGDGVWEGRIRIRKGKEYRYQFLIDRERWIADPRAPLQVEDGFGGANSLLQI